MESLFRKESMDQLTMHDKVGEYVSTTDRRGWLILTALLILIISFLVWAFTGSLPIAVSGMGYSDKSDREGHLFIAPDAMQKRNIAIGDPVHIIFPDARQIEARVTDISGHPMSDEEISETFGYNAWITEKVTPDDSYNYIIWIEAEEDLEKDMLFEAQVVEETVVPILYFIN
ncbi:MAG: hypothetical protein IJ073_04855 [Lachnospiraceae bacterium]|nr:hypothetical protein [Lachnospiraceae bacterium]